MKTLVEKLKKPESDATYSIPAFVLHGDAGQQFETFVKGTFLRQRLCQKAARIAVRKTDNHVCRNADFLRAAQVFCAPAQDVFAFPNSLQTSD